MPFRFNPLTGKLDIVDVVAPGPTVQETFVTDSGNTTSVANSINMFGGANINTVATAQTVTYNLDTDVVTNSYATDTVANYVKIEDNTITAAGTNANVDIGLVPKAAGGVYVTNNLTVGQSSAVTSIPYGGGSLDVALVVDTEGLTDLGGMVENRHSAIPGFGAHHIFARTRGTHAAPTTIVSGDTIGRLASFGYDGTDFVESTEITTTATGTIAAGKVPGQFQFYTADDVTGALQLAMTINNAQVTTLAQPLPVGSGGLGIATVPTNGQIPIGNGTNYTAATLTAGANISITNGPGTVTIAAGGGITWQTISANQALVANNGYICISPGGAISLSLPASAAIGTIIEVVLAGATSWTLTQAAGQQVFMGNTSSTLGATGTTASTAAGDSIRMVCTVADTTWYVISSIGNINLT